MRHYATSEYFFANEEKSVVALVRLTDNETKYMSVGELYAHFMERMTSEGGRARKSPAIFEQIEVMKPGEKLKLDCSSHHASCQKRKVELRHVGREYTIRTINGEVLIWRLL